MRMICLLHVRQTNRLVRLRQCTGSICQLGPAALGVEGKTHWSGRLPQRGLCCKWAVQAHWQTASEVLVQHSCVQHLQ